MKWYDERIWSRLLLLVVGMLAVICLSGCKTTRYVPLERTVHRESVRHDTLHIADSVLVHDSVSVFLKGDTVYKDRLHREKVLRKVYRTKVDTFIKRDSIPVPYPTERELSKWERFQLKYAVWSMGALCMVLVYLCYKLYKWIRNARGKAGNKEG